MNDHCAAVHSFQYSVHIWKITIIRWNAILLCTFHGRLIPKVGSYSCRYLLVTKRTANAKNKNNQTCRRSGKKVEYRIKSIITSPAGNYMFNKKTKTKCKMCSKLTIKIPEWRHWRVLLSLLLVLKYFRSCSCVFIVDFEEVNAGWKWGWIKTKLTRKQFKFFVMIAKCYSEDLPMVVISLHKKWSFPLRISSVNVTKSAENCAFGHIYWRNP